MQALSGGLNPIGVPGLVPPMAHPYLTSMQGTAFNPYAPSLPLNPAVQMQGLMMDSNNTQGLSNASGQMQGVMTNSAVASSQKVASRTDRLEPSSSTSSSGSDSSWNGTYADSLATNSQYSPVYFQVPGVMPAVKRTAVPDSKTGMFPVYQPGALPAAYQQLAAMQLQQNPYVPVTIAGQPPSMPRF